MRFIPKSKYGIIAIVAIAFSIATLGLRYFRQVVRQQHATIQLRLLGLWVFQQCDLDEFHAPREDYVFKASSQTRPRLFSKVLVIDNGGTDVCDKDLELLRDLPHLERLRLYGAKSITDQGLMHIASCKKLKELDLSGTSVTDEGLRCVEGLERLTVVYVGATEVSHHGVQRLKRALPRARVVTSLLHW